MNIDVARMLGLVERSLLPGEREGRAATVVVARRTYPTTITDLWDALTSPERLPRWFAPVGGELRVGGRFSVEGNASGVVLACDPPASFEVTWESGDTSWVSVSLTADAPERTTLELRHTAHPPEEFWDTFGPGAVGVGWDLSLLGLGLHLEGGDAVDPAEAEAWSVSDEGRAFSSGASAAWGLAAVAAGEDEGVARRRAEATAAFYAGETRGADDA